MNQQLVKFPSIEPVEIVNELRRLLVDCLYNPGVAEALIRLVRCAAYLQNVHACRDFADTMIYELHPLTERYSEHVREEYRLDQVYAR